ncbi:DUF397 domain-containing protein [Streptomyces iranensis]|uniref:DUF397 domain-containing protein n=1 Tax=Streptomyces iranensis TaxID=576784 RepID=UPI0039B7827E
MSTLSWRKSSFSDAGGNNCIEIAIDSVDIAVRESFEPDTTITTTQITLRDFIRGVKGGRLDHLLD